MKRTQIRAKRRTPRQRDAPREDADWWSQATVALLHRCGYACEHCGANLNLTGIERHHRQRRTAGGDRLSNILALCPLSHRHITENPAEAVENGWIVRANGIEDPAHTPVRINGYWWMLSDTGTKSLIP